MKYNITQEEIGRRIAMLRKRKGWSQDDLAKNISMSRSSLAQIELGNRNVGIIELQNLSISLSFSIDDFISKDYTIDAEMQEYKKDNVMKTKERISVPKLKVDKFKNVLLYILERCAGKPNVGETVLYKLLYFADFNYYELYEEQMTGANYRKLQFGPVPQKMDKIISEMIQSGQLQRLNVDYFEKVQTRYFPLVRSDLTLLKASEKAVIDQVIDQMGDWSAAMISEYSHGDKPWKATQVNEDLNYELAFYRRPPYSVRVYEEDEQDEV